MEDVDVNHETPFCCAFCLRPTFFPVRSIQTLSFAFYSFILRMWIIWLIKVPFCGNSVFMII